jgi:hypothetical protein
MTIEYAWEKLMQAVDSLATGTGRLQERLADAALFLIRLRPEDIPEGDLRRTFLGVMDDLTYAQGEEGSIAASLKIKDDEDARAIAQRIVALFHAIVREMHDRGPPRADLIISDK